MEAVKSKDSIQLLAEVTRELEYALAELWYHRRVSMTSGEFDKEYGDMLKVAKELCKMHLKAVQCTGIQTRQTLTLLVHITTAIINTMLIV